MSTSSLEPGSVFLTLLLRCHQVAKSLAASVRLTPDELYCLSIVRINRPPCVKDLSTLLGVRGPRTSRLLGTLEGRGLLRRTLCPQDHRREEVVLTKAGTALVDRLLEMAQQIVGAFESAGQESCIPALARVVDHLHHRIPPDSAYPARREQETTGWMILPDED